MTKNENAPEWSKLQTEVMNTPFPMLFGSSKAVDGYCSLELGERSNALRTLREHSTEASLWYRGLRLLLDPFEGEWILPEEEPGRSAYILRADILGLEVSSAKAALDLTLSGYYSLAFAAVRHMLESSAQAMYIVLFPDRTEPWQVGKRNPTMRVLIDQIKSQLKKSGLQPELAERFERLYGSWALMSKGAHPTGEGLLQTKPTIEDPRNIVGPVYRQHLAHVAFDHGLWALQMLLLALQSLGRTNAEWEQDLNQWANERQAFRDTLRDRDDLQGLWTQEEEELSQEE